MFSLCLKRFSSSSSKKLVIGNQTLSPSWSILELAKRDKNETELTENEIHQLANLSSLDIPKELSKIVCQDINQMKDFISKIQKNNNTEVKPRERNVDFSLQMRDDVEKPHDTEIVKYAHSKSNTFYVVPNEKSNPE